MASYNLQIFIRYQVKKEENTFPIKPYGYGNNYASINLDEMEERLCNLFTNKYLQLCSCLFVLSF